MTHCAQSFPSGERIREIGKKGFYFGRMESELSRYIEIPILKFDCLRLFDGVVIVCKIFGEMEIRRYVA